MTREEIIAVLRGAALGLMTLLVMGMIFLELFGYLWFADTLPVWAVVPPLTMVGLLLMVKLPQPWLRVGTLVLLALYVASYCFHGWENVAKWYESGDAFLGFTILEVVLVLMLATPGLRPRRSIDTTPAAG